jgi:hypothetical protein
VLPPVEQVKYFRHAFFNDADVEDETYHLCSVMGELVGLQDVGLSAEVVRRRLAVYLPVEKRTVVTI